MTKPLNVLVLCTGNSARSILGEALFNHLGAGRIRAHSAGSQPSGKVNPVALETLEKHGIPLPAARSKSWDEFAAPGAPALDYIFTVCASAAGEACRSGPAIRPPRTGAFPTPRMSSPCRHDARPSSSPTGNSNAGSDALLALPLETMSADEVKAAAMKIHEVSA